MYKKYKWLLFFIFGIIFTGFSLFFYWTYKDQEFIYELCQMRELINKKDLIVKQINFMLKKDNDWNIDTEFYKAFLINSIEDIDGTHRFHAALYDENFNLITTHHPKNVDLCCINIKNFINWCEKTTRDDSQGYGITSESRILCMEDSNIPHNHYIRNNKIYYCYAWIPSLNEHPRYLIFITLYPDYMQYTNYIYVIGPICMMIVYVALFGAFIRITQIIGLRSRIRKDDKDYIKPL